jgi:hypothetical protein
MLFKLGESCVMCRTTIFRFGDAIRRDNDVDCILCTRIPKLDGL